MSEAWIDGLAAARLKGDAQAAQHMCCHDVIQVSHRMHIQPKEETHRLVAVMADARVVHCTAQHYMVHQCAKLEKLRSCFARYGTVHCCLHGSVCDMLFHLYKTVQTVCTAMSGASIWYCV